MGQVPIRFTVSQNCRGESPVLENDVTPPELVREVVGNFIERQIVRLRMKTTVGLQMSREKHQQTVFARLLSTDADRPDHPLTLHQEATIPASIEATFAFFADAANLQRLTPPWLNFAIATEMPVAMCEGVEIEYRIRLYGLPIPWVSRIDVWEPGLRFVDRQLVGPYRWWHHDHRFTPVAGGTRVIDHVEYVPRMSWLSAALVRRDLERIFTYRQQALAGVFGGKSD